VADQEKQAQVQNELIEAAETLKEEFGWSKAEVVREIESVFE